MVVELNSFLGIDFGAYFGLLLRYLLECLRRSRSKVDDSHFVFFFVSSVKIYFINT